MNNLLSVTVRRLAITIAGTLLLILPASAQEMEQKVKAAFVYTFTKYVTWPSGTFESSSSPIIIGVVGEDSLDGALEATVNGKTVDGRPLVVRHYRWNQDLSGCQVLFVPGSEMASIGQLQRLRQRPVLTIGESAGFAHKFGMINFVLQSDRVRFEINGQTARDAGLNLSSKLLSLGIQPQ